MELSAGADLWVLGDLESSSWAQRIDWYLNFQIARASMHQAPEQPVELRNVIKEWEFEAPTLSVSTTLPLMIASSDLLPNHSTVVIPVAGDVKAWSKKVFEVWRGLDKPSLRVFLPNGVSTASFTSTWPGSKDDLASALIPEQT